MKKQKLVYAAVAIITVICLYFGINGLFVKKVEKEIVIAEGESANSVIEQLADEGIIKSKFIMKAVLKVSGASSKVQSGTVKVSSKMSYGRIKNQLLAAQQTTVKVTIPEGYELVDIVKVLAEKMNIPEQEFFEEIKHGKFDYEFITDELPLGENRLEGYIFPETYFMDKDMSAHQVLDVCLAQFDKIYDSKMREQTKKMGFSIHQMVTLASIIEKEGKTDLDKISSVFHNRLKSNEFSNLESCATVIYVTKQPKDRLTYQDIKVDSPYNTYLYKGLPPGPIASPGKKAIMAAIYPAETDYFYFSAEEGGVNTFSRTYNEHLQKQE